MSASVASLRKTYKYKLKPTPQQERLLDGIVWACRRLDNTALEQRIFRYRQRGVSLSRFAQEAELKDFRAAFPDYTAIHSQVLQEVLARLEKTYQAFFRRVRAGQTHQAVGFPRFQGRGRFTRCTDKEYGNGATLDNGFLVRSKIGRVALRWSRPLEGTPKTVTRSREADGW
jgi:putative transposase